MATIEPLVWERHVDGTVWGFPLYSSYNGGADWSNYAEQCFMVIAEDDRGHPIVGFYRDQGEAFADLADQSDYPDRAELALSWLVFVRAARAVLDGLTDTQVGDAGSFHRDGDWMEFTTHCGQRYRVEARALEELLS